MAKQERLRIVVGIDGFETGRRALDWALREALIRDCALHVVHAWTFDPTADFFTETSNQRMYEESLALLSREVEQATSGMTELPQIIENSVQGDPARVLPDAARGAAMLVVGRHRGGLVREVLGSVSAACVRHASCPVVVIPTVVPQPEESSSAESATASRG